MLRRDDREVKFELQPQAAKRGSRLLRPGEGCHPASRVLSSSEMVSCPHFLTRCVRVKKFMPV